MKFLLISFGSKNLLPGGLNRVGYSWYDSFKGSKSCFFLFLGKENHFNDNYFEYEFFGKTFFKKFFSTIKLVFRVYKTHKMFDKIHCQYIPLLSFFFIPLRNKIKFHLHGDFVYEFKNNNKLDIIGFLKLALLKLSKYVLFNFYCNFNIYNNKLISEAIKVNNKALITKNHNFIEPSTFDLFERIKKLKNPNSKIIFTSVAYWNKRKNISKTIEFLKFLRCQNNVEFKIIGKIENNYVEEFNKILNSENYNNFSINYIGYLSDEELTKELSNSTFFISNSKAEGFPRSFLEASFFEISIISHDEILSNNFDYPLKFSIEYLIENKVNLDMLMDMRSKIAERFNFDEYRLNLKSLDINIL